LGHHGSAVFGGGGGLGVRTGGGCPKNPKGVGLGTRREGGEKGPPFAWGKGGGFCCGPKQMTGGGVFWEDNNGGGNKWGGGSQHKEVLKNHQTGTGCGGLYTMWPFCVHELAKGKSSWERFIYSRARWSGVSL